jgi:hypothetical protein
MSTTQTVRAPKPVRRTTPGGLIDKYFYFFMSLLIAVNVVYGFSHTVDKNPLSPGGAAANSPFFPFGYLLRVGGLLHHSVSTGKNAQCANPSAHGLVWRSACRRNSLGGSFDGDHDDAVSFSPVARERWIGLYPRPILRRYLLFHCFLAGILLA